MGGGGRQGRKVQCRPRPTPSARFPAINEDRRNGDRARGRGCILLFRTVKREREAAKKRRPQKLQEAALAIFSTSFPLFKLMPCRLLGVEESKNQIRDQRGESDAKAKRVLMMFMISALNSKWPGKGLAQVTWARPGSTPNLEYKRERNAARVAAMRQVIKSVAERGRETEEVLRPPSLARLLSLLSSCLLGKKHT